MIENFSDLTKNTSMAKFWPTSVVTISEIVSKKNKLQKLQYFCFSINWNLNKPFARWPNLEIIQHFICVLELFYR